MDKDKIASAKKKLQETETLIDYLQNRIVELEKENKYLRDAIEYYKTARPEILI